MEILEKFTNLPYYAFLMEREREEEGEKRKKEPLFSCSPRYFFFTRVMLDHQVFLKATQEKLIYYCKSHSFHQKYTIILCSET